MASIVVNGDTSGSVTLSAPAVAGSTTLTLPATSGTILQSGTAVTEAQGGTGTTTGYYGFKNRLINSAMVIDQRNAGASWSATNGAYGLDRWAANSYDGGSTTGKFTIQQNAGSVTPPVGFANYLGVTSSAATTYGATGIYTIWQAIEGYNIADLAWGTANAKTITLSFQVYSSLTGTFGGSVQNGGGTRSYPFTYTISSANTWTTISVTIVGDTTTPSTNWNSTNGVGIYVRFGLGVGSTYSGTAGSWASANYYSATGATSVVGTNGATFYITGVQLEKGSTATSFDYRPYGTELVLCQRYYEVINSDIAQSFWADLNGGNSVTANANIFYRVTKRTTPTAAQYGSYATSNCNSPTLYASVNQVSLYYQTSGTGRCYWYPNAGAGITVNAEL